jgi:hypothetical protein
MINSTSLNEVHYTLLLQVLQSFLIFIYLYLFCQGVHGSLINDSCGLCLVLFEQGFEDLYIIRRPREMCITIPNIDSRGSCLLLCFLCLLFSQGQVIFELMYFLFKLF